MKKIILFDIDYTLSNRSYLKNFGRRYLANLVDKTVEEINPVVEKIAHDSVKLYQIFNIYFYAKRIAEEYQNVILEQKIIDMFFIHYPYAAAIYPEVNNVLEKLKKENILGIQSDGQDVFQLKKIEPIKDFFDARYIYIFKNKSDEIYKKIKSLEKKVMIIDDKPEHIQKLSKKGIKAILIRRGPYSEKYTENPKNYPDIQLTVNSLNDFIKIL